MIVLAIHPARHQYHTMSSQQVEIFFFMHDCSFGRPCRQYEQTKPLTSTGPLATSQKITLRHGEQSTRASRNVRVHGPFKPMPASSTLERSLAFELTPSGFHAICCCGAD